MHKEEGGNKMKCSRNRPTQQCPQDGAYLREHEKMMHRYIVKPFNNRTSMTQQVVFSTFERYF